MSGFVRATTICVQKYGVDKVTIKVTHSVAADTESNNSGAGLLKQIQGIKTLVKSNVEGHLLFSDICLCGFPRQPKS